MGSYGIMLQDRCCLTKPVVPTHDSRVRPYRPWPTYREDTIIQHYLQPAEMQPFYLQVPFSLV